ncbi:MAG: zinc ribbon domain-containing protein [Clostridiales bacterium]|nr:zinc ribbon domain-containing protein [Clostridiales bacterium]
MTERRVFAWFIGLFLIVTVLLGFIPKAKADALDEILLYSITVDVNEDGTLTMRYHFDWKVLDSTSEGPLSWIKVGIPNSNMISVTALSDNITDIGYMSEGGSFVRVDLDREYYADEVVSFDFELVQDYMYEMNRFTEGETYYEFTPGWFDADVDSLIIKWRYDGTKSASPAFLVADDGYMTWETSLSPRATFTVSVTYPNEAYAFDETKSIKSSGGSDIDFGGCDSAASCVGAAAAMLSFLPFIIVPLVVIPAIIQKIRYNVTANFSGGKSREVITREKIVYHSSCPSCGAPRPEGKDVCDYCGSSFIKSKETISEEKVPEEMKDKKENGTYHYGSDPNTFIRINVAHIPIVISKTSTTTRSGSCAHSSCACASHCACACACACAGGGRAGCSVKDFYNTGLKLKMLENRKKVSLKEKK